MGEAGQGGSVRMEVVRLPSFSDSSEPVVIGVDMLRFNTTTLLMREGKRGPEAWAAGGEKGMDNEAWGRRGCEPSSSQSYLPIVQPEEQRRQRSIGESSSWSHKSVKRTVLHGIKTV
jgi:hypothetical protein